MKDNTSPREIKRFFRLREKGGWKKASAMLVLLLLLLLSYPPVAHQQSKETLLQEIENYIKRYYIYHLDEGSFPLQSLEELPRVFKEPYSAYLDKERMEVFQEDIDRVLPGGIGVSLEQKGSQILVTAVFPATPAERAGIKGGDLIVSVDGSQVSALTAEEVALRIRGEKGSRVRLFVRRDGRDLDFAMVREKISLPLAEASRLDEGIVLVRVHSFGEGLAKEMARILKELQKDGQQGLILDLRNNQGGYVEEALAMCSLFTDGVLLNVRERDSSWQEIRGPDMGEPISIPMAVLVNGGTASAGEITASALKENKAAILVGDITFGKGTMQTLFELEGGGCLKLTTAEFISLQGRTIEGSGVEPQYLVPAAGDQLQVAQELLRDWLEGKKGVLQPLRLNGQIYFPLRPLLQRTGRGIAAGESPGVYLFYWNGILYRLDLGRKILSGADQGNNSSQKFPVLFYQGSTYVQERFLEEGMGLPFW